MANIARKENDPQIAEFNRKREMLDMEATLDTDNENLKNWQRGKIAAIMTAGSFAQINALMTESGLTAAQTLVGRTFEIKDFQIKESAEGYRTGASQLEKVAYVEAVDTGTGEEFIIDGGGDNFVSGLVAMRDLYGFPFTGTLLGMATSTPGRTLQYWRFADPKREPFGPGNVPGNAA